MNPLHREGWPLPQNASQNKPSETQSQPSRTLGAFGNPTASQQQTQPPSAQSSAPVLPPPGSFFSGQTSNPSLPHIAGLTQTSQSSPPQAAQGLPSMQTGPSEVDAHTDSQLGTSRSLQSGQSAPQRHPMHAEEVDRGLSLTDQRENDNAQSVDTRMRDAEQQEREEREQRQRQQLDAAQAQLQSQPHENHAGSVPLHQPVAVAPVRSIHGPNGILGGGSAPVNGPMSLNAQLGAPSGPSNLFGGAPTAPNEPPARAQPAAQASQAVANISFPSGAVQQSQAAIVGQGQQPILNDALSYLDQVKVQFADRPDVYNKFLDIMKDFKSGAIDTPGVIDRVSNLFAGNPNLIQGFNTFLPPGYKIECGTTDNPNAIRVTTPMGTTTSQLPSRPLSNPRQVALSANGMGPDDRTLFESAARNTSAPWQSQAGQDAAYGADRRNASGAGYSGGLTQNTSASMSPEAQRAQQITSDNAAIIHQQEQRGVSQLQNAATVAGSGQGVSPSLSGAVMAPFAEQAVNGLGAMLPQGLQAGGLEKRGPVEFNHAISYVNKIKNRFSAQPDIYKQFLEILQTYQRESKPIQEVYGQVTQLFSSAPDLLEDFKQFLPESAAHAKALAASRGEEALISNMRNDPGYVASMPQQLHTPRQDQPRMPPVGNFAPTPQTGRENKRKRQKRQAPGPSSAAAAMPGAADTSAIRGGFGPGGNVAKRQKQQHGMKPTTAPDVPPVSPTLVPSLPMPLAPTISVAANPDELHFFDRVKKFIGNKNSMNEFLKLCNLYSEQLIDKIVLVRRAHSFIGGNPELMMWFRTFIGYKDEDEVIENKPRGASGRVALTSCRSFGPSYRLLPKRETQSVCSGRDELCRSVLNDEWASHPTWASEDSGFVAHRKNIHEEGLHRIEEERHDYDFNIEACARTVQLLEPIAQQMLISNPEDRTNMQLPTGLGGQSETIYRRVIMKIYGRDRGRVVIEQMFQQPYNVVPTVLNRVKQRLEEWKAAQREWEKVWREQTQKIFWRSLDHQSAGSKVADKRQFQTKTLQNEIQVKFQEQKEKRERGMATAKYQFCWGVEDFEVVMDASRLVLTYAQMSHQGENGVLEDFIKDFVSTFFGIDRATVDQGLEMESLAHSSSDEADTATPATNEGGQRTKANGRGGNLHRAVLERGRAGRTLQPDPDNSVASGSRATTPGVASGVEDDGAAPMEGLEETRSVETQMDKWMIHPRDGNFNNDKQLALNEPFTRDYYHMFCNLPIYCFVRMFLILYERLLSLKDCEREVDEIVRKAMAPKPARDLGMIDKYPSDFFYDVSGNQSYYKQMIRMFEENLQGETDMNHIEETLRRYYLQNGWQLNSFDKLLGALARFAMAIRAGDSKDKTWEIWLAFKKDRAKAETTYEEEMNMRRNVDKYIKEGDMYRITLKNATMTDPLKIFMRLFAKDEPTFDLNEFEEERNWSFYVTSWTNIVPTEGIVDEKVAIPFVRRSQPPYEAFGAALLTAEASEKLEVRIIMDTYKPSFSPGMTEYVINPKAKTQTYEAGAEVEQKEELAADDADEKIVMNSSWTRDMTKSAVDAQKAEFTRLRAGKASEGGVSDKKGAEMVNA